MQPMPHNRRASLPAALHRGRGMLLILAVLAGIAAFAPLAASAQTASGSPPATYTDSFGQTQSAAVVQLNAFPANASTVAFSIASASASAAFTPVAGRTFHLTIPAAAMSAVCPVERSFNAGATWVPLTVFGAQIESLSLSGQGVSEDLYEAQAFVEYRLDCGASLGSYASGTVAGSFTQ